MSAWIRREVVHRRGWMGEREFVGGLALAQIVPGANGVNLAVFVGTTLRGPAGALAAPGGAAADAAAAALWAGHHLLLADRRAAHPQLPLLRPRMRAGQSVLPAACPDGLCEGKGPRDRR